MFPVRLCRCTLPPAVCLQGELYFKTAAKAELRAERWGGRRKKAALWARSRPTYQIIPVYVRQLLILTWGAAGAGQKAGPAPHLPPQPGSGSRCSAVADARQQAPGRAAPCTPHTGVMWKAPTVTLPACGSSTVPGDQQAPAITFGMGHSSPPLGLADVPTTSMFCLPWCPLNVPLMPKCFFLQYYW